MRRALPLLFIVAAACQTTTLKKVERYDGAAKFEPGEIVVFKINGENGQILSADCKGKDPCSYRVRYENGRGELLQDDFNEIELGPVDESNRKPAPQR